MKFTITTKRLAGKYDEGQVVDVSEGDKLYGLMQSLVKQGEAKIAGAKKEVKKDKK